MKFTGLYIYNHFLKPYHPKVIQVEDMIDAISACMAVDTDNGLWLNHVVHHLLVGKYVNSGLTEK